MKTDLGMTIIADAKKEAEMETSLKIAKKMLVRGVSIEDVMDLTDLEKPIVIQLLVDIGNEHTTAA